MIEVLERGEAPQSRTYTERCYTCNSLVKFDFDDGKVVNAFRRRVIEIECPVCKADTIQAEYQYDDIHPDN